MSKIWTPQAKPPLGSQINWGHPLSKGLVGCWLMNEGGGNAINSLSPKGFGNLVGPTWGNSLKGLCLNFSTNQYIPTFSYQFGTGNFTILVLMKRASVQTEVVAGQYNGSSGDVWWLGFSAGKGTFSSGATTLSESSATVNDGNWHLLGGRVLSGTTYLIRDNKPFISGGASGSASATTPLTFGRLGSLSNFYWGGSVAQVQLWNRALSYQEIQSLYVNPYQFILRPSPRSSLVSSVSASCVLTGTITGSINESDIVTGGKTIILTLTGDTWIAAGALSFDLQRQNIINGITSAQSETFGWNNVVKVLQGVSGVVRTSDTIVTITLDAEATYNITSTETITATVPATALVGNSAIVASPTFTVSATVTAAHFLTCNKGYW